MIAIGFAIVEVAASERALGAAHAAGLDRTEARAVLIDTIRTSEAIAARPELRAAALADLEARTAVHVRAAWQRARAWAEAPF